MSIGLTALCYLYCWDHALPLQGGLAYERLLRACRLDYSVASLARIDIFLDALRTAKKPSADTFLDQQANQNLLLLLGFYTGEVIARSVGYPPAWYSFEEIVAMEPGNRIFGEGFHSWASCCFPPESEARLDFFMPLYALSNRLLAEFPDKSIAFSAGLMIPLRFNDPALAAQALPPLPPQSLPIDLPALLGRCTQYELDALEIVRPPWAEGDDLARFFDHAPGLLRGEGRVVWGALVQANNALFEPWRIAGAPGEVVYDPQGRLPAGDLAETARRLFALKGQTTGDAALDGIAGYLADERTRVFGLDLPARLLPYPLKLSTTYVEPLQLPDGMLALRWFPLLVADHAPGIVRILPSIFWPAAFRNEWLAAGEAALAKQQAADAAPAEPDPAQLFEQGLLHFHGRGVVQDQAKARRLWEQAAQLGDAMSHNNLGLIHEAGLGVKPDLGAAFRHYQAAARLGFVLGQLNVGKMHLRIDSGVTDLLEAAHWLKQAAAQGNEEARQLLVEFELG